MAHHAQTFMLLIIIFFLAPYPELPDTDTPPPTTTGPKPIPENNIKLLALVESFIKKHSCVQTCDHSYLRHFEELGLWIWARKKGDMQVGSVISVSESFSKFSMASYIMEEKMEQVCNRLGEEIEKEMVSTASTEAVEEEEEMSEMEEQQKNLKDDDQEEQAESEEDEDKEFSFVCVDPDGSPISADDIFYDGKIRPVYPLFNQELIFGIQDNEATSSGEFGPTSSPRPQQLRKIFVEHPGSCSSNNDTDDTVEGTFYEWTGDAKERCKKSNSTGFSQVWRFRDLLHRSSSDGKDAFVFLQPATTKKSQHTEDHGEASTRKQKSTISSEEAKAKGKKSEKPVSALDRHYMRNRVLKEEEKRRSYLPYKVGFFTSVSLLSRNVHPF